MYNCENEIECPSDKYIKYFLWSDYFHDSKIETIHFCNSKGEKYHRPNQVVITIESCRDIDAEWDRLKGTYDEKKDYISKNRSKYLYNLYFDDCKYFNYEKSLFVNDYINGRFKNSSTLQKIMKNTNKYYYHFRIGTDDGFLDVVFSKFRIKKSIGRIYIKDIEVTDYNIAWLQKYNKGNLLMQDGQLDEIKLLELLNTGDGEERYFALYYFIMYTKEKIINYARDIMDLGWDNYECAKIMAIHAIGVQGDKSDEQLLIKEYFAVEGRLTKQNVCYCSTLLPKRHIMDAIEKIKYRENHDYEVII